MTTQLSRSSVVVNDETLNYGDKITKLLCKTDLSLTITFLGSLVLLSFHVEYRDGEHEPGRSYVSISLFQLGNCTSFDPGRYRRIDLQQICVGRNVSFECSENDRGFYVEWKGNVLRIEYRNGCLLVP